MKLFRVTNWKYGEWEFYRVYVWCETVDDALKMAQPVFRKALEDEEWYDTESSLNLDVEELMDGNEPPFVTQLSSKDFER